jgi:hypothetical protein
MLRRISYIFLCALPFLDLVVVRDSREASRSFTFRLDGRSV